MIYKQCVLIKDNKSQVAWIPGVYAIMGKMLVINDDPEWVVNWSSSIGREYEDVNRDSRDYLRTRKYTDI